MNRRSVELMDSASGINASWLLLGEGQMVDDTTSGVRDKLLRVLDLERFIPVMSEDEVRMLAEGRTDFGSDTVARWERMVADRKERTDAIFREAYKRQEELCRQRTVN